MTELLKVTYTYASKTFWEQFDGTKDVFGNQATDSNPIIWPADKPKDKDNIA